MSLSTEELTEYLARQLNNFFPDRNEVKPMELSSPIKSTLERIEYCFSNIHSKYFFDGKDTIFNHLCSDQYSMFLYMLSSSLYKQKETPHLSEKVYCLNKALHAIDVYYEVELPDIFMFTHCVGTVIGRAKYADYLIIAQNCTIGNNHGIYPAFEGRVFLFPRSSVIGESTIGGNTLVSADTYICDQDVEGDCIVSGRSPNLEIRPSEESAYRTFFKYFNL
ncbi:MAG: serine acetyltransferase [Deltaproteobacteria bacterium]|uniref:Serine acetyltransferase n=1 Tax=Candidatus Zymogenus saltonus TaxID=2844893 RepID=A0A9D8KH74_9DELT|nr:serine acetyltransferase [Candidatus Zymogenus saltonus]